jgi:hypothetical protein
VVVITASADTKARTLLVAIGICRGKADANVVAWGRVTVRRCAIKDLAPHTCRSINALQPARRARQCAHACA